VQAAIKATMITFLKSLAFFKEPSQIGATSPEAGAAVSLPEPVQKPEPVRHVSPVVAHELNNVLTIIQGYSDSLLLQRRKLRSPEKQLQHISEAARRATLIVRNASLPPTAAPLQSR
jgi:hypothetical protein